MMKSTKREKERRFSFLGFGLALVFFALPAVAWADSGGWLLNEEDGSEAQVNEALAGADEMLQPTGEVAIRGVGEPYVGPEPDPKPNRVLEIPHPPWKYDTDYFFGLSRGLFREDVPTGVKAVGLLGSVPLDLVGLPFAALGGFYGS